MGMHVSAWPPYHCRVTPCTRIALPRLAPFDALQRRHSAARSANELTTLPSTTWPACHGWPCSAFVSLHVRQRVEGSASARATTSGASLRYRPLCQAARATYTTAQRTADISTGRDTMQLMTPAAVLLRGACSCTCVDSRAHTSLAGPGLRCSRTADQPMIRCRRRCPAYGST